MNAAIAVCLVVYILLCVAGFVCGVVGVVRATLRLRQLERRRTAVVAHLVEYAHSALADSAKLDGYADLSRWVTANMLLASHRERRRGVEARC